MRNYITLILAVLTLVSCKDELELSNPSGLDNTVVWSGGVDGARAVHNGLYGALRGQMNTIWSLGAMRSDVWGGRTFESPFDENLYKNQITVSTAPFTPWGNFYGRIHQVNDFIEHVTDLDFDDESEKNHYLGEAYGIRAFYYYILLKTWGPVVISDQTFVSEGDFDPSNVEGLSRPRSSEAEVMDFIKQDIERSLSAFGDDDSFWQGNKNYWSKAATLALKGDVYIWSGTLMGGGDGDFTTAKNALNKVAATGISLVDNYEDLWGADNENNAEFIFAIQYAQDEATNFFNSYTGRGTEIHPKFDSRGNSMDGLIIAGGNRYGPSDKTIEILDDNRDSRKLATFIYLYDDGSGYSHFNNNQYFGSILNKFLGRVDGAQRIFDSDLPIYRYADVLLMLAEAKNHLHEDPSDEINRIRKRAYGDNYDNSVAYTNGSEIANANAILDERYKEFVAEGKRWWDLRRAGDQFVLDNVEFIDDTNALLLPISSDMMGSNPELEQTPGW